MKLDETKLQELVEKVAYQQFGQEQVDDLYAKMGIVNEYVQQQLRLFAVSWRSEQLISFLEWRDKQNILTLHDYTNEELVRCYEKEINCR